MASSMESCIRRASLEARRRVRCKAGPVSTGPLSFDRRMKTKDDALFSSTFFFFPSPFLLSHGWYVTWRCCLISTCTISAGHDEWGLCRRLIPFFFPSVHRRSFFFFACCYTVGYDPRTKIVSHIRHRCLAIGQRMLFCLIHFRPRDTDRPSLVHPTDAAASGQLQKRPSIQF